MARDAGVIIGVVDGVLVVFDRQGNEHGRLAVGEKVDQIALSDDGCWLAVVEEASSERSTIALWEVAAGVRRARLEVRTSWTGSIAFVEDRVLYGALEMAIPDLQVVGDSNPTLYGARTVIDARFVVIGAWVPGRDSRKAALLWDRRDERFVRKACPLEGRESIAAFEHFLFVASERRVNIYDLRDGTPHDAIERPGAWEPLAISRDGHWLLRGAQLFELDWHGVPEAGALARRFDGDRRPPICDDLDAWIANHDGLYYDLAKLCRNHPHQLLAYADHARPTEAIEVLRAALREPEIAARAQPWAKLATLLLASDALDDAQDAAAEALARDLDQPELAALIGRARVRAAVPQARAIHTWTAHAGAAAAIATCEGFVISGGADGTVGVWTWPGGQCARRFEVGAAVTCVAVADGRVAAGTTTGDIWLWHLASGAPLARIATELVPDRLTLHQAAIGLGIGGGDPAWLETIPPIKVPVSGVALRGDRLVATCEEIQLRVWRVGDDARAAGEGRLPADGGGVACVADRALARTREGLVAMRFDTGSVHVMRDGVTAVGTDGDRVLLGLSTGEVERDGVVVSREPHLGGVSAVCGRGALVASLGWDNALRWVDGEHAAVAPDANAAGIAITTDQRVITCHGDGTLRVWAT